MPLTPPTVGELFELPETVQRSDFVLNLARGVAAPEETVRQYVVTPSIQRAFNSTLGLIAAAHANSRSLGLYVHGSFGSGKSHFMAMLSLLLEGSEAARRHPELHGLRADHPRLRGARLLQLRFHMVGQQSLEAAVFRNYTDTVARLHPGAPLPPLFDDAPLFESAQAVLAGTWARSASSLSSMAKAKGWRSSRTPINSASSVTLG